jgi:hypothetical protein
MNKLLLPGLLAVLAAVAGAQPTDQAERARISAERTRAEARFEEAQKACYGKFAVNDCLARAQAQRREVLADLRRQEVSLNDADRRRRSAERMQEVESRQSADKQRQRAEAAAHAQEQQRTRQERGASKARKAEEAASSASDRRAKGAREPKQQDRPDTDENLRRHQERLEDAQEHRAKVEKRAADSKKNVKPLPVPP